MGAGAREPGRVRCAITMFCEVGQGSMSSRHTERRWASEEAEIGEGARPCPAASAQRDWPRKEGEGGAVVWSTQQGLSPWRQHTASWGDHTALPCGVAGRRPCRP